MLPCVNTAHYENYNCKKLHHDKWNTFLPKAVSKGRTVGVFGSCICKIIREKSEA